MGIGSRRTCDDFGRQNASQTGKNWWLGRNDRTMGGRGSLRLRQRRRFSIDRRLY